MARRLVEEDDPSYCHSVPLKKRLHDDPCFKVGYSCATVDIMDIIIRRSKRPMTPEVEQTLAGLVDEIQNLTEMLETGDMN
jgi:hypothetical protein